MNKAVIPFLFQLVPMILTPTMLLAAQAKPPKGSQDLVKYTQLNNLKIYLKWISDTTLISASHNTQTGRYSSHKHLHSRDQQGKRVLKETRVIDVAAAAQSTFDALQDQFQAQEKAKLTPVVGAKIITETKKR